MPYLLVFTVRGRNDLRQIFLVQLQHILQELQIRLVGIVVRIWLVEIRDERTAPASAELRDRQRGAHSDDILKVEVRLTTVAGGVLVVEAAAERDHREVLSGCVGGKVFLEQSEVTITSVLLEVAAEADFAAAVSVRLVVAKLVQIPQTLRRDLIVAINRPILGCGSRHTEIRTGANRFLPGGGVVRTDLSEAGSRLDHVDMLRHGFWDGVLEGAQPADIAVRLAYKPLEVCVQEVIGHADGRAEVDPVGVLLDVGDTGGVQPVQDCVYSFVAGEEHPLHLVVRLKVLAVVGAGRC